MKNENIIQKIWSLCNILRGDGISYHEYVSELTYLLFLKIAQENKTEYLLPEDCRWQRLADYQGSDLLTEYRDMLTYLGGHAENEIVRRIYAFPTTVFSHSENLKAVIEGIAKLDWHSITIDGMGDIYEGLLAKNSQDARSGAGQYFTPRALVDSIIRLIQPSLGQIIQDPAVGSGGFLISADQYIRDKNSVEAYKKNPPRYEGVEIEKGTFRICLMNAFLHQLDSNLILGDALTKDAKALSPADIILANPPFGAKAGSVRKKRDDISNTTNKQLAFLQHIYLGLKKGGRAAVVLPDNVLFEEGVGKRIRQELMDKCDLHTILRLPVGIFYSQGVKTNVMFFTRGYSETQNTKEIWIYDMRTSPIKFGRKRPLSSQDFFDFEQKYHDNRNGLKRQSDDNEGGRWRSFNRQQIADRMDNLDISWLGNTNPDLDETLSEPEEIAAAILNHLREAMQEIENLSEELDIKGPEILL
ncbi:MAG: N-6 DNA methylase [Chitinophagaceae bacterium]